MRNLKRVLSLALASAMLFGMMVMGAGAADTKKTAADLTDIDKVTHKEAVGLMVDLGIIVGKPDGSFAPTETIDRATMAKLITYVLMGNVDAALFEGTTTDLKDIDSNWAKGYIKYCYANKIITGDGAGSFFPGNKVTVVQAAKMLLVSLGYDAKTQKYEGDSSWSVNIMRDAKSAGLLDGVTASTNDDLTRDNAAQMIFNALFANTITYTTQYDGGVAYKTDPSKYDKAGVLNATLGSLQYTLNKQPAALLTLNQGNTGAGLKGKSTIGGSTYPIATKVEDIGKNVVYYTYLKDGATAYSATAVVDSKVKTVTVPANLISGATTSTNKNVTEWLNENGLREAASPATTAKYVNYYSAPAIANGGLDAALNGVNPGETAYVIDQTGDGIIDALVVNTLAIDFVTGDVKTTTSGTSTTVYIPGVLNGYTNVDNVVGYADLKKDDVVFTMTVNSAITYITKAETFTGKITGYNTGKNTVTVDGTVYEISANADTAFDTSAEYIALGYTNEISFWKDATGKLAFAKSAAATASSTVAIVLAYQAGSIVDDSKGVAKILSTDGTVTTVDVSASSTLVLTGANNSNLPSSFIPASYTVDDDGSYIFKTPVTSSGAAYTWASAGTPGAGVAITRGQATGVMGSYVGNANTAFLTATWNATNTAITGYTVAKGIANAPSYTAGANGAVGYVLQNSNLASVVLLTGGVSVSGGSGDYLFTNTRGTATYDSAAKTYTIDAFVNGVKAPTSIAKAVYENALTGNGLYKVDMADGVVTGATLATALTLGNTTTAGTGVKNMTGVIATDTSNGTASEIDYWTYNDETQVYVVDSTGINTVVSALKPTDVVSDTNDTVSVYGNGTTKVASVILINKVTSGDDTLAELAARFTSVKYGTNAAEASAVTGAGTNTFTMTNPVLSGITVAANDYFAMEAIVAANGGANPCNITIKIEGVGTAPSAPVTLSIPANYDGVTATSVAGASTYKILAGTTSLKITVTITDGETEFVQIYTSAVTITP